MSAGESIEKRRAAPARILLTLYAFVSPTQVRNIEEVRSSLMSIHRANVVIPAPIAGLVSRRAFAMDFVEDAFKMSDVLHLSVHGVDKAALLRLVVHLWALMLLRANAVNADPHPGNLMVRLSEDGGAQPVLLDWGWVVRLSPEELQVRDAAISRCSSIEIVLRSMCYRCKCSLEAPLFATGACASFRRHAASGLARSRDGAVGDGFTARVGQPQGARLRE